MARPSVLGPGTEAGKLILDDFKNWRKTGFQPWGSNVGSVQHYRSRQVYQVASQSAFRSQAKKIAKIAIEQLPANEIEYAKSQIAAPGPVFAFDSEGKNAWERQLHQDPNEPQDDSSDDEDFLAELEDESVEDLDEFEEIQIGELQNSRSAILSEYPCGAKLLAVFPLDGNICDHGSNEFEFDDNNTIIKRWSKIPKERLNAVKLIGIGTEKSSAIGFTDVDLVVLDAEIKKRLKQYECRRDDKGIREFRRDAEGFLWEVRETLELPFKCRPFFFNKKGQEIDTFRKKSNGKGFAWAFFWLLAWTPPKAKRSKRIKGKMVKVMNPEDASQYTERTVY